MQYQGPETADLADVEALNRTFLDWLRRTSRRGIAPEIGEALASLRGIHQERLARTPFLLVSVAEDDHSAWRRIFAGDPCDDLFAEDRDEQADRLVTACVGFLWQLAKKNPYAVRLVTGAGLDWCRQLGSYTLIDLTTKCRAAALRPQPRMADDADLWRKLLTAGKSKRRNVRRAARVAAMHRVLTATPAAGYRRLATAACEMPPIAAQLADRR